MLAAIEAVLVAKGLPQRQREAVMAATTENLTQRKLKVSRSRSSSARN
ncbi:MAG: hypothetical protein H7337_03735 [Rhizobacter sp.]|nr:hypothetical protein [Rhizobacter sp.]